MGGFRPGFSPTGRDLISIPGNSPHASGGTPWTSQKGGRDRNRRPRKAVPARTGDESPLFGPGRVCPLKQGRAVRRAADEDLPAYQPGCSEAAGLMAIVRGCDHLPHALESARVPPTPRASSSRPAEIPYQTWQNDRRAKHVQEPFHCTVLSSFRSFGRHNQAEVIELDNPVMQTPCRRVSLRPR